MWGGNERYLDPLWKQRFWDQPVGVWQECPADSNMML
jgi:hypothetical protein